MIKKFKQDNILRDKVLGWKVNGKILKFNILCKSIPRNAVISIRTEEHELLFEGKIDKSILNIYPINSITKNIHIPEEIELVQMEDNDGFTFFEEIIIPEQVIEHEVHKDYYYSYGNIFVTIQGLEENEKVDSIKIIFETENLDSPL